MRFVGSPGRMRSALAKPPGRRLRCARRPTQKWLPNPPRRQSSAAYRLRIVQEADGCTASGELGQLLRRQGLYSLQLSNWLDVKGGLQGLAPKKRGAKATQRDPDEGPQDLATAVLAAREAYPTSNRSI